MIFKYKLKNVTKWCICRYSATVKSSTIFLAMHNKYFEADIIIAFILFWDALPSFEKKSIPVCNQNAIIIRDPKPRLWVT